jgi:hypothetical protein
MTTRSISNQVETIKSATLKASSSKEAAVAFLSQAGIIGKPVTRIEVVPPNYDNVANWKVVGIASIQQGVLTQGSFAKATKVKRSGEFTTKKEAILHAKTVAGRAGISKKRDDQ